MPEDEHREDGCFLLQQIRTEAGVDVILETAEIRWCAFAAVFIGAAVSLCGGRKDGGTGRSAFWHCEACGMAINDRHRKKLQQIVEYLNQGEDDKKLAALFSGVEIGEIVQYSPKEIRLECGAVCSDDFVPPKNICCTDVLFLHGDLYKIQ